MRDVRMGMEDRGQVFANVKIVDFWLLNEKNNIEINNVLTGARQVGKSTMFKKLHGDIRYVTLNRPFVRDSAKTNPTLFFEQNPPPVVVDEIQKAAELFDYIKDIVDESSAKG